MRLINADKLKEDIKEIGCDRFESWDKMLTLAEYETFVGDVIDNAPTIDKVINVYPNGEVIVQEKRPRGKWGEVFHHQGWNYHKCSNCHLSLKLSDYENFCPNCGADMREDSEA